ncbi:MAG: hypothetical protein NC299_17230, partial [Lachnospiraceae bacterium]|nr:hypothetical protein [Ruminococcus sp.]MCM1277074.1 hypothetical protein [Lachnospiraceae bacterium]
IKNAAPSELGSGKQTTDYSDIISHLKGNVKMIRYNFDYDDGTVDEIDTDEELRREEERGEYLADEYREREFAATGGDDRETEYWNDLERRKYALADKLLARAYGED